MSDAAGASCRPTKRPRPSESAEDLRERAKRLWAQDGDLARVEALLRESLAVATASKHDSEEDDRNNAEVATTDAATDALALLCAQSDHASKRGEAVRLMQSANYLARLSSEVLWYNTAAAAATSATAALTQEDLFCLPLRVIDQALPITCLQALQQSFCSDDCDYWTSHDYSVYPPSPYFSYVAPLHPPSEDGQTVGAASQNMPSSMVAGPLGQLIDTVRRHAEANFEGVEVARFAEVWAHRRPHCSGHQLHFDSDNEGIGGAASIRNPLVSAVCYLTEEGLGGPTLVTDQCLGDRGLAQNGWLAFPKLNHLVIFDGQVLHGVIPGRGHPTAKSSSGANKKRVTVMVALWDDIRIRNGNGPGAARPMPLTTTGTAVHLRTNHSADGGHQVPKWASELLVDDFDNSGGGGGTPSSNNAGGGGGDSAAAAVAVLAENELLTAPLCVSNVWTRLDGTPLSDGETPHYNRVFQGF